MKLPIEQRAAGMRGAGLYSQTISANSSGGVRPSACLDATVGGGKACIKVPIIGSACLPAPGVPNLGRVSACCNLKKTWGIPHGVKCCLKYQGAEIYCKSWGL